MDIDIDDVDPQDGLEREHIVGHDEDGNPTTPGFGRQSDLGRPMDVDDEFFQYHDPTQGIEADIYYEPIGMVNDNRLVDIYRYYAKRAQSVSSDRAVKKAETIKTFVEARGLEVPDVSDWYVAEMPRETVRKVEEEIPEFFTYAEGLDSVMLGESTDDEYDKQQMRVRFCECDLDTVTELTDADPEPISGPNAFDDE